MNKDDRQVFRYPLSRIGTIDLGRISLRKHHVAGLLEVDESPEAGQASG